MSSLNAAVALTALPNMNVELPMDGLARNLHLELLSDMGFVEGSVAIGADAGQRRLVELVDLCGTGRLAVGLGAVVLAGLAAGFLGIGVRIAFGEAACLALAGTDSLVELTAQPLVIGLQVVDSSLKRLAVSTSNRFHYRNDTQNRDVQLRGWLIGNCSG